MTERCPIRIGWGWTACDDSALSLGIRWFTRPGWAPKPLARWSHMFLVCGFKDEAPVIHEALGSRGWSESPLLKVENWRYDDAINRHYHQEWLNVPKDIVRGIWRESLSWIGTRSYAFQQLATFAMAESLAGRALRRLAPTVFDRDVADDRVICSEGACRLVGVHWPALDLRADPREQWANISPQAAYDRYRIRRLKLRQDLARE